MAQNQLELTIKASANPPYIYVSKDNVVHVMLPIIDASLLNPDAPIEEQLVVAMANTCKTTSFLKSALGKASESERLWAELPNQPSVIDSLKLYKKTTQDDINRLRNQQTNNPAIQEYIRLAEDRITQVDLHLQKIDLILNRYPYNQYFINLLNNIPEYPKPFELLLNKPTSNIYNLLLAPAYEDRYVRMSFNRSTAFARAEKTVSPNQQYFDESRNDVSNKFKGRFSTYLSSQSLRKAKKDLQQDFINKVIAAVRAQIPPTPLSIQQFIKLIQPILSREFDAFRDDFGETGDIIFNTRSLLDSYLSTVVFNENERRNYMKDFDKNQFNCTLPDESIDDINECISNIQAIIGTYSNITYKEASIFDRIFDLGVSSRNNLSIQTQLFISIANSYAKKYKLTQKDFARVLDDNPNLVDALGETIVNALQANQSVEEAILKFIDNHFANFGMSRTFQSVRGLSQPLPQIIAKNFNKMYKVITVGPHLDETLIQLPQLDNSDFFYYNCSMCVDSTAILDAIATLSSDRTLLDSKFDKAKTELRTFPTSLVRSAAPIIGTIKLSLDDIKAKMTKAIGDNDLTQLKFLESQTDNQYVFEKLGRTFFTTFDNNVAAQKLLRQYRLNISDPTLLALFNKSVFPERARLTLDAEGARALYVALASHCNLSILNVSKYDSPEAITFILSELFKISATNINKTNPLIAALKDVTDKRFTVNNAVGQITIEASQQTLTNIEAMVKAYKNKFHISMSMAASIYKEIGEKNPGWDLVAMSTLPGNNKENAKPNTIYIDATGNYVLLDRKDKKTVHEGKLPNLGDLSQLNKFKKAIVDAITQKGHIDPTIIDADMVNSENNNDPTDPGHAKKGIKALQVFNIMKTKNTLTYNNIENNLPEDKWYPFHSTDLEIYTAVKDKLTASNQQALLKNTTPSNFYTIPFTQLEIQNIRTALIKGNNGQESELSKKFDAYKDTRATIGGGGFIAHDLTADQINLLMDIHDRQRLRFVLPPFIEQALYAMVIRLGCGNILEEYAEGSCRLEAALTLLNIQYNDTKKHANGFLLHLEESEQAKIRKIALTIYKDEPTKLEDLRKIGVLDNREIQEYTKAYVENNFAKALLTAPAGKTLFEHVKTILKTKNGILPRSEYSHLKITPHNASSILAAVQDRMNFKGADIKRNHQFSTANDVEQLLNDLQQLGIQGNRYSQGYEKIRSFLVNDTPTGIQISAPEECINILKTVIAEYDDCIHLSMTMAASLYKAVGEKYGFDSPEYLDMQNPQKYNNNTPGDPTPYKLLRAFELLELHIAKEHVRYNNTLNDLEYKPNVDAIGEFKGGTGFILKVTKEQLKKIEELTERQTHCLAIGPQMLFGVVNCACSLLPAFSPIADHLVTHSFVSEVPPIVTEQDVLDTFKIAIHLLGIDYKGVKQVKDGYLLIEATEFEQSKLKVIIKQGMYPDDTCYPFTDTPASSMNEMYRYARMANDQLNLGLTIPADSSQFKTFKCSIEQAKTMKNFIARSLGESATKMKTQLDWQDVSTYKLIDPSLIIFNKEDAVRTKDYVPVLVNSFSTTTTAKAAIAKKDKQNEGYRFSAVLPVHLGNRADWPTQVTPFKTLSIPFAVTNRNSLPETNASRSHQPAAPANPHTTSANRFVNRSQTNTTTNQTHARKTNWQFLLEVMAHPAPRALCAVIMLAGIATAVIAFGGINPALAQAAAQALHTSPIVLGIVGVIVACIGALGTVGPENTKIVKNAAISFFKPKQQEAPDNEAPQARNNP